MHSRQSIDAPRKNLRIQQNNQSQLSLDQHSQGMLNQKRPFVLFVLVLAVSATSFWIWGPGKNTAKTKDPSVVPVISAAATRMDVPVHLTANGTVAALQSVEVRAQINATIKSVHVHEGRFVKRGDRLFSLDVRTEDANLGKSEAQVTKSRADLANAERNLRRQRELFNQKFISQTALDAVQNQADSLRAQLAADLAAVEGSRIARDFGEIVAPIAGRTGAVAVYPGSLVQSTGTALVSITQIDPINVSFTLPESELPSLQKAFAGGGVEVTAQIDSSTEDSRKGKLVFIDNSVDSASGTIRLKASFANADGRLWPGMFVTVALSPRTLVNALVVPLQAVQTGPEKKFIYVIGDDGKVVSKPARVLLMQDGRAVIDGINAGDKVVVEGAQNLRPGRMVVEAKPAPEKSAPQKSKP